MKLWLNGAIATCRFELQRSFTFQRTSVSLMLALFPPTMLFLLSLGTRVSGDLTGFQDFAKLISVLLISLVCLLSQLLWATPNVYSELEGKSWGFIASRPGARISILLGKFLASFVVSFAISLLALSLCVIIADRMLGILNPEKFWIAMSGVYLFACLAYSAIFSLIGTLFIQACDGCWGRVYHWLRNGIGIHSWRADQPIHSPFSLARVRDPMGGLVFPIAFIVERLPFSIR